jgi:hypothetical protein
MRCPESHAYAHPKDRVTEADVQRIIAAPDVGIPERRDHLQSLPEADSLRRFRRSIRIGQRHRVLDPKACALLSPTSERGRRAPVSACQRSAHSWSETGGPSAYPWPSRRDGRYLCAKSFDQGLEGHPRCNLKVHVQKGRRFVIDHALNIPTVRPTPRMRCGDGARILTRRRVPPLRHLARRREAPSAPWASQFASLDPWKRVAPGKVREQRREDLWSHTGPLEVVPLARATVPDTELEVEAFQTLIT